MMRLYEVLESSALAHSYDSPCGCVRLHGLESRRITVLGANAQREIHA